MGGTADFDAVVVGAGAGGGFAAMALAEAGMRVLVLERGPRLDPRDYPMNHDDWELRDSPFALPPGPDPTITYAMGAPLARNTAALCSYALPGRPAQVAPSRRGRFRYERVFGVGGTTLHYQGEAHRYADHCFRSASEYGFGVDWPLDYAELTPWYERVERVLGVAGAPGNPFKPARGPFPTPAHTLSPASRRVRRRAAGLGWALLPNTLALPTRSVDGRTPCQRSGGCVQGCIFGAKSSVDQTAIPRGERTGRLVVETGARALQLETGVDGRVSGVVYRREGALRRAAGRVFVLAMGALETPRLLLASQAPGAPRGLGNAGGQVGIHFTESVWVGLTVRFDENLQPYKGPPIDARIWDFSRPAQPGRSGFGLGVSGTMSGYHGPVSYAERTPGFGLAHKRAMRERFGTVVTLFGVADHEPRADNRLVLADHSDPDGMPLLEVQSSYSAADRAVVGEMIQRCRDLAEASGAVETVDLYSSYDRPASSHPAGTCRMGSDPERSVVDPWGRVHGVGNLYITDASVLPGQGAGDAPTLTIQALALRTAEHVAARARHREL